MPSALSLPLAAASDVLITSIVNGQVLTWDSVSNRWINATPSGGGGLNGEQVDDRVAALLVAGTNITLTYDNGAGTLTITAAAGGGGGVTLEEVDDHLGTAFGPGIGTKFVYDDLADEFQIDRLERLHNDDDDGSAITFDLAADVGEHHEVTLGGNRQLAVTNQTLGQKFRLKLNQDSTGGREVLWFAGITWVNGYVPAQTPVPQSGDTFAFLVTNVGGYGDTFLGWILSTERPVIVDLAAVPVPVNETQTIESSAVPTGGTWTISFNGNTTSALTHSVNAPAVQAALRALPSIGAGNVNVSGGTLGVSPFVIEFVGALAGANQPQVTMQSSLSF